MALILIGAAAACGFAPLELWLLTVLGLAWLAWSAHQAASLRGALLRGWWWGLGHFTINNNWIQHAFDFQDKMPPVLGYFAVVLLAVYLAVYPAIAAGLAWRLASPRAAGDASTPPGGAFALVFGAAWIASEWLRATMFTGYAWNPVGVVWLPVPGVSWLAAWIGTYALSGLTALAGAALIVARFGGRRLALGVWAVLSLAAVAGLFVRDATITATNDTPRVRVVQPNIGQEAVRSEDYDARVLGTLAMLSGTPQPFPRLVVWPEGAVNYFIEPGYPERFYWKGDPQLIRQRIAAALGPRDQALVGGNALAFDAAGEVSGIGNSIFRVGPDATLGARRYDKAHLVPYGEYLPMAWILEPLGLRRLVQGEVDFVPGPGPQSLGVPGFGRIGMQVCYEIIFSGETVDRADRPDMLFNPSNDAWFGTWGPPQHLAQARMRAIEEGLPILRSTPTGISAVIDARGRLLASVPHETAGAAETVMPPPLPPTPFSRIGNLAALLVALVMLAGAVAIRRRAR
ncbi:apolipoprotein N-acyltransferase [Sphingomonas baiyangensis]|uniref:Apolipoprotein N-acyltransferase n=1 Tax=Sphingomonas baiyangensis TaxID=2572576 RepID=A0A4U1L7J3_9SPHN|nr:apolipoprotein N-acyltransferase [Sphingomonas baiyangensis]